MSWFWKSKAKAPTRMCPNGHVLEPTWVACPYCPAPSPRATQPAPAPATMSRGMRGDPGLTMSLEQADKPPIVGFLIALGGKHKGQRFDILEGKNKIGKNADCEVVITDEFVSGEHALISYDKDEKQFRVTDIASTNGTFVYEGGEFKKIASREILENDKIRLGKTEFQFKRSPG